MNAGEAQRTGTAQLAAAPMAAAHASRDAELLLMHALSVSRAALMAHPEQKLSTDQELRYLAMIERRAAAEPVQYIVGEQEFYGLRFRVSRDVLIPRPETEHLVEAVLQAMPKKHPVRIADVGTGSGAIAVALAKHLPLAEIFALDISPAALRVAGRNAEENGVAGRIQFLQSDLLQAVAGQRFDAVVSNPPYVALGERAMLEAQVREFEPALALFAGDTGFEAYERLIPQAESLLRPGGLLALEIGSGQAERIAELLRGWSDAAFIRDLQGIKRVALARRI